MQVKEDLKTFIVIVTFNGMKWLPKCLESTKPYPVILIDNCSTDGTKEFIKSNHPKIILLEQEENLGFGQANNIGISYALKNDADFVFLLNQDAFLESGTIKTLLEISGKNPEYGILSPVHLNADKNGFEETFKYYITRENSNNEILSDLLLKKTLKDIYSLRMVNAAAWLLPRKTFETVGGFHPMFFLYGEDDNYCQRVLYHGFKIGICPTAFICHDSNLNYHTQKTEGSEAYYNKFLNQIRVKYANVNAEEFSKFSRLKSFYIKRIVKSLIKFKFGKARVNWHKLNLIKGLDFSDDIEKGRKINNNYLEK